MPQAKREVEGRPSEVEGRVKPPFTIDKIDHVLLLVDGMERSLGFYENVLGCRVESRMPDYGMAELRAGASTIALVDITSEGGAWAKSQAGGHNVDHVALAINSESAKELRDHLGVNGVEINEEREEGDSLSLYVSDPSGNTIELLSRSKPN